jgi:hypothetical protein
VRVHPRTALALLALIAAGCHRAPLPPSIAETRTITLTDLTLGGAPPPEQYAERLGEHVEAIVGRVERCYAERLDAGARPEGEHRLNIWVSARQVIRVTAEASTLADPALEGCIKRSLLAYPIPPEAPRGGVRVRFRLLFAPPPEGARLTCAEAGCELVRCGAEGAPSCPGRR